MVTNFCFLEKHKELFKEMEKIEKNMGVPKYEFDGNVRRFCEKYLESKFIELKEVKNLGSKINWLKKNGKLDEKDHKILGELGEIKDRGNKGVHNFNNIDEKSINTIFNSRINLLKRVWEVVTHMEGLSNDMEFDNYIYENKLEIKFVKQMATIFSEYFLSNELTGSEAFLSFLIEKIIKEFYNADASMEDNATYANGKCPIDAWCYDKNENTINILIANYATDVTHEDFLNKLKEVSDILFNLLESKSGYNLNERLSQFAAFYIQEETENIKADIKIHFVSINKIKNLKIAHNSVSKIFEKLEHKVQLEVYDEERIFEIYDYENNVEEKFGGKLTLANTDSFIQWDSTDKKVSVYLAIVTAKSIADVFDFTKGKVLEKNVRAYITNKKIDEAIKKTIIEKPEEFMILNNGITIIGDFDEDNFRSGKTLNFRELNIINGGQTTTLLSKNRENKKQLESAHLIAKIIKINENKKKEQLISDIANASNQQKPIKPEDLLANDQRIKSFADYLVNRKSKFVFLNKRDSLKKTELSKKSSGKRVIEIKELLQIFNAFYFCRPDISRSSTAAIFKDEKIINSFAAKFGKVDNETFLFFNDLMNVNEVLLNYKNDCAKKIKKTSKEVNKSDWNTYKTGTVAYFYILATVMAIQFLRQISDKEIKEIAMVGSDKKTEVLAKAISKLQFKGFLNKGENAMYESSDFLFPETNKKLTKLFECICSNVEINESEEDWSNYFKKIHPQIKLIDFICDKLTSQRDESFKELIAEIFV